LNKSDFEVKYEIKSVVDYESAVFFIISVHRRVKTVRIFLRTSDFRLLIPREHGRPVRPPKVLRGWPEKSSKLFCLLTVDFPPRGSSKELAR
jgi:hypothetical protein